MPVKPDIQKLQANSVDVMNAIRADASAAYQEAVPCAQPTTASIQEIGKIIMNFQPHQNEFVKALINRIGRVLITSRLYENPWAGFKKGLLEFGETLEEIFVNIARPFTFDPSVAEKNVFKREIPDVRAAFHTMNYQKFYKQTISNDQLRQAFLSWNGITDLIAKIVDSMYTGANYDEFITMKYMIAQMALQGNIYAVNIPAISDTTAKQVVTEVKGLSNTLTFMNTKYNMNGVANFTPKEDQFVIINAKFDAQMDVEVLASAFNMDKAEFMGRRILVDSFANLDIPRLQELFGDDPTFVPPSADDLARLDTIPIMILDRDWFMILDNFYNFTEIYNAEGLYWNYFFHVWKTFSASPFANAALFTTETPAVTAVAIAPTTATIAKGANAVFTATVTATGFAQQGVSWTLSGGTSSDTIVLSNGTVYVGKDETATGLTLTATSLYDGTKSGTAAITIPAPTA